MKKSVRILLTVIVFVLIAALSAAIITASGTEPGTVAEATALLDTAKGESDLTKKSRAFDAVSAYLEERPIDSAAEGYAAFVESFNTAKLDFAKALLAVSEGLEYKVDENFSALKKIAAVNSLKTFLERNPIDEATEGYADFKTKYDAEVAAQEKYKSDSKDAIENQVSLDDYELPTHINSDFNGSPHNMSLSSIGNTAEYQSKLIKDPDTGRRVWSVTYNGASSGYTAYYPKNVAESLVLQFDVKFNKMPDAGLSLQQEVVNCIYATFRPDGSVTYGQEGKVLTPAGLFTEGQWINLALVIRLEEKPYTYDIYIDYHKIAENLTVSPWREYTPNNFRFTGGSTSGNFYLDNVFIYRGTALRTVGRIDKMSADEKYLYYTRYAADETKSFPTRKTAYLRAEELYIANAVSKSDPQIIAAKAVFDGVVLDELTAGACEQNTQRFVKLVGDVAGIERHPDTEAVRLTALAKVDEHLTKIGSDYLGESDEYKNAAATLNRLREELVEEERVRLFNAQMLRFTAASTIAAMQTHYDKAKALLEEGISVDIGSLPGFETFAARYAVYLSAADTLREAILENNSKKIVDCVGFISRYTTEEEWVENYDKMERYVLIIRETLASGEYDIAYDGLVAALNIFNPMEEFFYARLQNSHIAYITEQLALYAEATDYVEQVGIIATIKRYVETADIDPENEEIAALLVRLDYCDAEVKVREEDYALVLRENSAKFILLIENLIIQNGYADTRAVFEEAAGYYNSIDRDYEGIAEAIAIYKEYEEEYDLMDVSSQAFIDCVALLATARRDEDVFAYLVDCYYFYPSVNAEIEGVSEALAAYKAAYDKYNAEYVTVNTDIEEAVRCTVSVRASSGVDSIVAIIFKYLIGE